jgi:hypothetical protein
VRDRLFTFISAASLLLCVYALVAAVFAGREGGPWLRGYDLFRPLGPPRAFTAAETNAYRPASPTFSFAGFRAQPGFRAEYTIQYGQVYTVPFWFLSLVFGVLPGAWARMRWRQWRRARLARLRQAGVCPSCGYDLRASPDQCPECGTPARSSALSEQRPPSPRNPQTPVLHATGKRL